VERSKALFLKKVEHQRAQTRLTLPPQFGNPHSAARSARRTVLVRAVVEDGTDIPNISMPDRSKPTRKKKLRKPYVTSLLKSSVCLDVDHCHEENLAEEAWDSARVEKELQAFHCGVTMEKHSIGTTQFVDLKHNQDGEVVSDEGLCQHMHCGSSPLIGHTILSTSGLLDLCPSECGLEERKILRAQARSRTCFRKKQRYQQRIGVTLAAPHQMEVPHGAARSARRTCLARGALADESDIPKISMPDRTKPRNRQKKPFVSPVLKPLPTSMIKLQDFQMGNAPRGVEGEWDVGIVETEPNATCTEMPLSEVLSTLDDRDMDEFETSDEGANCMPVQQEADGTCLRNIEVEESEAIKVSETVEDTEHSSQHSSQLLQHSPEQSTNETCKSDDGRQDTIKKEGILRQLVAVLQTQLAEAQSTAAAARVQTEAAEDRARMAEEAMCCTSMAKKDARVSIAEAQKMEKQRAIALRRKHNQEAQLRATRDKAEQELITAQQIRDEAQEKASAVAARIHAQADAAARTVSAAKAEAELQRQCVQAELRSMKSTCMEMAIKAGEEIRLQAQAAADATRQHVQQEAAEAMRQAEADVEQMKNKVETAARAQVQHEVCEIRSRALADAQSLRSRAFEQLRFRAAKEASLQEAKMQSHAEKRSREEFAQTLQTVKAMERQRAKQFRQQAEKERREKQLLDQELVGARAKAEAEIVSLRQAALLEVKSAKRKASAQAEQVRRQARRAAAALQADAVAQAQALKQVAKAEAREATARAANKMAEVEEQQRISGGTRIVATPEEEEAHVKRVSCTAQEEEEEEHWDLLLGLVAARVGGEANDWTLVA